MKSRTSPAETFSQVGSFVGVFFLCVLGILCQPLSAQDSAPAMSAAISEAVNRAEQNRAEIAAAWVRVPADQREGLEFLLQYMPTRDLTTLTADYLLENVDYAYRAWREAPWHDQVSPELFYNDVLPYANINERRDRWRKDFYDRFAPLVKDAKTPGEAAAKLNQQVFNLVKVHYSTRRPKADQSPYESIDAGMASCTGLSILLIDACRAVGVPARFVGIPMWTDNSGNHSWVEVWDNGWHFTGADEATGSDLDKAWFVDRASQAQPDSPRHSIYAVSYRHTPTRFPLVWERGSEYVRGVNVTERYLKKVKTLPADHVAVMFRVLQGKTRDRCAVNFRIRDAAGNVVFQGQTKDERFDANDHLTVPLPKDQKFQVEFVEGDQVRVTEIQASQSDSLVTLQATTESNVEQQGNSDAASSDAASSDAAASDAASIGKTLEQLAAYLAQPRNERGPLATQSFAANPLTAAEAQQVQEQLWQDHVTMTEQTRRDEFDRRELTLDGKSLRFAYKVFGDKPDAGHSLYISMHGGGNAPELVNDRQWENQKSLYEPKEGIYLAPRAPTNTWNLWHEAHIDPLFDRLIADLIVFEKIDPNRVYLLGYSAGGDGVYQLAPRFADRLAAASMMAGHPNEASPLGLRNLPFTLHMGGEDAAYRRNQVAREWGDKLDRLQQEDPQGYEHSTHIHAGKGHWMDRNDEVAIEWLAAHTRNPFPDRIVWYQDDVTHRRYYWLAVAQGEPAAGWTVRAERSGQSIQIDTELPADADTTFSVLLNDAMLDLDRPISLRVNGGEPQRITPERTIGTIAATLEERGDPRSVFSASVPVRVKIPSEPGHDSQ